MTFQFILPMHNLNLSIVYIQTINLKMIESPLHIHRDLKTKFDSKLRIERNYTNLHHRANNSTLFPLEIHDFHRNERRYLCVFLINWRRTININKHRTGLIGAERKNERTCTHTIFFIMEKKIEKRPKRTRPNLILTCR